MLHIICCLFNHYLIYILFEDRDFCKCMFVECGLLMRGSLKLDDKNVFLWPISRDHIK